MPTKKIGLGEMWKSETSGNISIVTSFCREISVHRCALFAECSTTSIHNVKKAKMLKTDSGETLIGFKMAEVVIASECPVREF